MSPDWSLIAAVLAIAAMVLALLILPFFLRALRIFDSRIAGVKGQLEQARADRDLWFARLEQEISVIRAVTQQYDAEASAEFSTAADAASSLSSKIAASSAICCELAEQISSASVALDRLSLRPAP